MRHCYLQRRRAAARCQGRCTVHRFEADVEVSRRHVAAAALRCKQSHSTPTRTEGREPALETARRHRVTTRLNPYLSFSNTAKDAMQIYHSVFGGDLTLSTFAEMHANDDPGDQDKIMHS